VRGAALLLVTLWLAAPVAPAAEPEGWAYVLSKELMSPFCPGRTLSECPSPQADSLRMWMIVQEAAGRPRAEVEAELLERYGDVVLAAPRAEGIGIAAYVIPVIVFVAGGALVAFFLRRQTRGAARPAPPAAVLDPELERIVDRELDRG
jgi:cytochrome c-type biogenesis protein CcmH/NrfF